MLVAVLGFMIKTQRLPACIGRHAWLLCATAFLAPACFMTDLPEIVGAGGVVDTESECLTADDCNSTGTDCLLPACVSQRCVYEAEEEFVPVNSQFEGDCQLAVCDGVGGEKKTNVDDPFDDGNECTVDTCNAGEPATAIQLGVACAGGVCDPTGTCVACLTPADCSGTESCQEGLCVPKSCTNGIFEPPETHEDCGGPCAPCEDGFGCSVPGDCVSQVCKSGICQVPTCDDEATNGSEADTDCGGPDCGACEDGASCNSGTDCESGVCTTLDNDAGLVCAAPSCNDGVANGSETGIDCGGPTCGRCGVNQPCEQPDDCASGVCEDTCQAPTCDDGVKNGSETGIDCGGQCNALCLAEGETQMGQGHLLP